MEQADLNAMKRRLLDRSAAVRADIRRELAKYDQERYGQLADRLADPGEHSVADLLVDLDLAEISRDVQEFREIEAALLRIAHGSYGQCIDCDEAISPERLDSMPAASRCYACQQAIERKAPRERHPSL